MAGEREAESPNAEGRGDRDLAKNEHDDKRKSGMDPRKRHRFILIASVAVVAVAVAAVLWWLHARNYESTEDAYVDARIVHVSPG